MRAFSLRGLALCAPTLFLLASAATEAAWDPIPPDVTAVADCPKDPGCTAAVLEEDILFDNEYGHPRVVEHRVVKIFKGEGLDAASVKVPYVVGRWSIQDLEGRTLRPDGSVVPLDPSKAMEETVAKARGYRRKTVSFQMPGAEAGAILEYRFKRVYSSPIGTFAWYVQDDVPLLRGSLVLVPGPVEFAPTPQRLPGVSVERDKDAEGRARLTVRNIPALHDEPMMPPKDEARGRILLFPANPWWNHQTVGAAFEQEVERFFKRASRGKKMVAEVVGESPDPKGKAERIYAWVQDHLKNRSYQESAAGEAAPLAPNLYVDDVLGSGGGTASDLVRVFVYFARQGGLEAEVALVDTRDDDFFNAATFIPADLDGEVAAVKLDNKWSFFDPGTRYCPSGLVGRENEGASAYNAVIPRPNGGVLALIPASRGATNLQRRRIQMEIQTDGGMIADVELEVNGLAGADARNRLDHQTPDERRKGIEDVLRASYPDAEVQELTFENLPEWTQPLRGRFRLHIPGYAAPAGSRLLIPILPFRAMMENPFTAATRQNPIYFEDTYQDVDQVTVRAPAGYEVESLPSVRRIDLQALRYRLSASQEGSEAKIEREMLVDTLLVDATKYSVVRNLYEEAARLDASELVLRKAGSGGAPGGEETP